MAARLGRRWAPSCPRKGSRGALPTSASWGSFLDADADGFVAEYRLRQPDQKRQAVNALKSLNFQVIAAGDSYNDTAMLGAADAGFLMHAPPHIAAEFPQFALNHSYAQLLASIDAAAARLRG